MQSYINEIECNNKKLFYMLKKKNIEYVIENDFIKISINKNNLIIYHNKMIPQFILYENSDINFQKICENININIDNYELVEDIIYEIDNKIFQIQINKKEIINIIKKDNINDFNKKIEEKKNTYIKNSFNENIDNNNKTYKKGSSIFSLRACVEMFGDQIIKIYSNEKFNVNIDNFPNIKITMNNFTFIGSENLIVDIDMKINLNTLNQSPTISLSSNKILKDNILQIICQLKPFTDINSWSIKYSIYDSIVNIHNMITKFRETKQEFSTPLDETINNLEYLLSIKNENISEIKLLELFDKDLLKATSNQESIKNKNEYWKKGTGYGHGNVKEWNIDEYIKQINEKKQNISKEYNKLFSILTHQESINKINAESIILLLLNYIQNEEISKENIIIAGDLLNKNIILLNDSELKYHKTFIKLLKLIKNYFDDNNINHILIKDNITDQIIKKVIDNTNLDPFTKIFGEYKFKLYLEEFKNFYYSNNLINLNSEQILRLNKEFNICKKSISINSDASMFFYVQSDKINKMKFIISGPKDTPYDQGLYIFDMTITKDFPSKPPLVHFLNHGSQRFNPNLYNCGKVCLSLLGTWKGDKGESWNLSTSSLFQILVSIQSQILIDEPYFNEPGYESYIGKPFGITNSKNYNYNIRQYNLDHAINGLISNVLSENNSYPEFTDIIKKYFKFKKDNIIQILNKWENELNTENDKNDILNKFTTSKNNFIELVNKL